MKLSSPTRTPAHNAAAEPGPHAANGDPAFQKSESSPDLVAQMDGTTEQAMRESQKLISIGKLTAEIAHEINNPLESIGNLIYLALHEAGMPPRAVDYLRTAERELERVVQISKQTLSFSRESAEPVPIHVAELMDEVVGIYARRMAQKQLTVRREYAADEPILALPGEIRQVLSNLVTNAIEALSPGGTLRLRVRTSLRRQGMYTEPGIRVSVGDNGSGIPAVAQERLGKIFFTTKGDAGTGLGLWVTCSIVARHGGTIRLRSSTGKRHGTVFSVFLPTKPASQPAGGEDQTRAPIPSRKVMEISNHPRHFNHSSHVAATHDPGMRKREG